MRIFRGHAKPALMQRMEFHNITCRGFERRQILLENADREQGFTDLCHSGGANHIFRKRPERVRARRVEVFRPVREPGMAGAEVGKELSLTESPVNRTNRRGEEIAGELGLAMMDSGNA